MEKSDITVNTSMSIMPMNGLKTCSIKLSRGPSSRVADAPAIRFAPVAERPIPARGPADDP